MSFGVVLVVPKPYKQIPTDYVVLTLLQKFKSVCGGILAKRLVQDSESFILF